METNHSTVDVLIIGAGPAGSACALALARQGRSVLLLDKARFPRPKTCGGGVSPVVGTWLDLDFSPVIQARVTRFRFTYGLRDAVEAELDPGAPLWMVRRASFDAFLARAAVTAGAEFCDGTEVRSVARQGRGWVVEAAEGRWEARVLVLAEGALGRLHRQAGFTSHRLLGAALEAEPSCTMGRTDTLHMDFGLVRRGYAWAFPKADGWSIGAGRFGKGEGRNLRAALDRLAEAYGLDLHAHPSSGHPLALWDGDQPLHSEAVLLAGEAAAVVDPFSAEGIRPAIASGLWAAEAAARGLSGHGDAWEGYSRTMAEQWGREMLWARRLAAAFYAFPGLAYRRGVKHPAAPQAMARIFCGEARYQDLAGRALRRLGLGWLE